MRSKRKGRSKAKVRLSGADRQYKIEKSKLVISLAAVIVGVLAIAAPMLKERMSATDRPRFLMFTNNPVSQYSAVVDPNEGEIYFLPANEVADVSRTYM